MELKSINSAEAPGSVGSYSQAIDLSNFKNLVFISGQIPVALDGSVPVTFEEQCDLTWKNLTAQLKASGLGIKNLVKVNTFVASRDHLASNREVREKHLGDHKIALSVVIAGIFDESWLLEIEAIAAY